MILSKIVAGALAIVWDIESAFVGVNITQASMDRGAGTCTAGNTTALLTNCGQTLSTALVNLIMQGTSVLNNVIAGLSLQGTVR